APAHVPGPLQRRCGRGSSWNDGMDARRELVASGSRCSFAPPSPSVSERLLGGRRNRNPEEGTDMRGNGRVHRLIVPAALAVLALLVTDVGAGVKANKNMSPTVVNPNALGKASASMSGRGTRQKAKLRVTVRQLAPGKTFTVKVADVPIGTLTANAAG